MIPLRCLLILFALLPTLAEAVEVYAVYGKDCQAVGGAIIWVDEDSVHTLSLDGTVSQMPVAEVELVARYNTLENPFPSFGGKDGAPWSFAVLSSSDADMFPAYAISFFEDLVLFLDEDGRIRVVEIRDITALKESEMSDRNPRHVPIALNSPPGRVGCPAIRSPSEDEPLSHVPTQVMSDKLRVDSFLARMRKGYRSLRSLKERTSFYSRPILFDQKSRLGIHYPFPNDRNKRLGLLDGADEVFPIYLEFGGGDAYRFQSATGFGTKTWRTIPQVRPIFGVTSEFKSHLLHGILTANLSGFAAGRSIFSNVWIPEKNVVSKKLWLRSSFNHLTLLGADYGPFSVSYGYYFPVFALGRNFEYREIVPSNSSPVFRFGYLRPRWQWELFFFNTRSRNEISVNKETAGADFIYRDVGNLFYYSPRFIPEIVKIKSYTLRSNFRFHWTKDLVMQADALYTNSEYNETSFRRTTEVADFVSDDVDLSGTQVENYLQFTEFAARLQMRMDMGQWVAVKGEAHVQMWNTEGLFYDELDAEDKSHTDTITSYFAALELLL